MIRTLTAAGLLVGLAACQGGDRGPTLETTQVIGDDAGRPFQLALSPDGTRLAYAMPVDGQGAILVAGADGSDPVQLTHGIWDRDPRWSPDGRWIAYLGESPDFDIFVVPSDGGEPRQLTSGPERDSPAGWLPDGSAVLVYRTSADNTVHTLAVPLDGGPERPVVPLMRGRQYVSVSPDGSKAAFDLHPGAGDGAIWVQDLAGGEPRQITTEGFENALPTTKMWAPDGRSIAYVSRRTGTWDIWIADVETGETRQLTTDIHSDWEHTWSPDGRWIAFLSDRGGQTDVWIVPSGGGQPRRVTEDLDVEGWLAWSADGRSLYYVSSSTDDGLEVMPVEGGPSRALVDWPGYRIGQVEVSPDGRTVLFDSDRSGNWDVWSVPLSGGEPTPFAASPLGDSLPRFSPDGSQVAFVSGRAGSPDVWVTPAAGGEPRRLTDFPSNELWPRWSPDGSAIAFVSDRDASNGDLWLVPQAGGEARRLTSGAGIQGPVAWAPDGQALYYVGATPTGTRDLHRVPRTGGAPETLGASPHLGGVAGNGDLSPDGSEYAYATFEEGWGFIEVVSTAGGAPRRMSTRTERVFQPVVQWSPDGSFLVVLDYDYPTDTYDLQAVTWPEGSWRPLTETPGRTEVLAAFTPDGRNMLVGVEKLRARIVSTSVASLLTGEAGN